jgi:hypothetical protein
VSHKGSYGENPAQSAKRAKRLEAAIAQAFNLLLRVYRIGFEVGLLEGKRETTTGGSSAVSPVTNIGHGASRKPSGRNK